MLQLTWNLKFGFYDLEAAVNRMSRIIFRAPINAYDRAFSRR